jgi:hypothetical protein
MKRIVAVLLVSVTLSTHVVAAGIDLSPANQPVLERKVLAGENRAFAEADAAMAGERQAVKEEQQTRKHSWDNFLEVHFGGYRWLWWAGAGAALIAIHVAAD